MVPGRGGCVAAKRGAHMLYQDLAWTGEGGLETKALNEGADIATFTGIASTATPDRVRDIIVPGAFGTINAAEIKMYRDHNHDYLIGGYTKFEQKGDRLEVEGQISLLTEKGRETHALMKQRFLTGLSVGYLIEPGGASWDHEKRIRHIKKAELMECSVCSMPCNKGARISAVKSLSRDDTWQWLRDNGLTDDDIDVVMKKGFDALLATSGRTNITEIDGFSADDKFTALAAEVQALFDTVKERRLP